MSAATDRWLAELAREKAAEHAERLALKRRNRRLFAERFAWPAGALAACERLDREFPDWVASWWPGNPGPRCRRPAGYVVSDMNRTYWAATLEELADWLRVRSG